jgi:hypothetical protein
LFDFMENIEYKVLTDWHKAKNSLKYYIE